MEQYSVANIHTLYIIIMGVISAYVAMSIYTYKLCHTGYFLLWPAKLSGDLSDLLYMHTQALEFLRNET